MEKYAVKSPVCYYGLQYEQGCFQKLIKADPTTATKIESLADRADQQEQEIKVLLNQAQGLRDANELLQSQVAALQTAQTTQGGSAKYQIAATRWSDGQMSFTQVFRVNTATGEVCQVVGPKYRNGEP